MSITSGSFPVPSSSSVSLRLLLKLSSLTSTLTLAEAHLELPACLGVFCEVLGPEDDAEMGSDLTWHLRVVERERAWGGAIPSAIRMSMV